MAYANWDFYNRTWHGSMTAQEFERWSSRSSLEIDRATQGRAAAAPESMRASTEGGGYGLPDPACEGGRQDTLGRLRWVRDLLQRQLLEAEPTQAARLAKEYRDTVEAIERMEGAEGGGADDGLDALAGAIARKLG